MIEYNSLENIKRALDNGKTSCALLVDHYLNQIEKHKNLNAFVEVYSEEAKQAAIEVDRKIKSGSAGRLAGMVVGLKDVLCHQDHGLHCSSKILEGFESQFTATAVQRLLDEDAIVIGRCNCDEFAMGSSNENSAFGPVLNALDTDRVPGGSSGGSAVAVQGDMCLVSLGTDTGGSVRQPAAFCGVFGLKPTYSRISRFGLAAYASSFDCIGIFAKNIEDMALVLEIMAGPDAVDSTVSNQPVPKYSSSTYSLPEKIKIAYLKESVESPGLQKEIKDIMIAKLESLKAEGHTIAEVSFPLLDHVLPTYYILTTAEASSNLSRYDGVKYGYRSPNATDLESMYKKTRAEGFGNEVKRRIMLGTFVLSASYYDAYYTKAQKVRRLIRDQIKDIFKDYDYIILPTTPTTAFKIGENTQDPLAMYLADLFTVPASVAGIPGISLPAGNDSQGLPVGLQVMANDFKEEELFTFSKYLLKL